MRVPAKKSHLGFERIVPKPICALLVAALLASTGAVAQQEKTKLAVMKLEAERGIDEGLVKLLNELLLTEFVETGKYEVIGSSDIKSILQLEEKSG
jgi:hypothetical protein